MEIFDTVHNPQVIDLLKAGAVGVLATDTLYGLVCNAADKAAVDRLYSLKGRERKPGTLAAANIDQLVGLGFKARYLKVVEQYWPGAISIVIPCGQELAHLHLGIGSIAVRVPADQTFRDLLLKTGPLLTTSANSSGDAPAATVEGAKKYFGDTVDFYVNGGDLSGHEPSTVIRIIDDAIEVLRPGAVRINEKGEIE